jgi:hypothetical protein
MKMVIGSSRIEVGFAADHHLSQRYGYGIRKVTLKSTESSYVNFIVEYLLATQMSFASEHSLLLVIQICIPVV